MYLSPNGQKRRMKKGIIELESLYSPRLNRGDITLLRSGRNNKKKKKTGGFKSYDIESSAPVLYSEKVVLDFCEWEANKKRGGERSNERKEMDVRWSIIEKAMKRHFPSTLRRPPPFSFCGSSHHHEPLIVLCLARLSSVDLVHLFNLVQTWEPAQQQPDIILCGPRRQLNLMNFSN
jgi:hypothetical protein